MPDPQPIRRVTVISTGAVRIRPQHVRSDGSPMMWWLLTARAWTRPLPINVYVIEHSRGLVLFDTGQDRASVTDPGYFPGGVVGFFFRRLASFRIGEHETLTAQLGTAGYDIADVHTAVLSHLHQDHIGGLPELLHARVIASATEHASVAKPLALLDGVMKKHIELPGLRWEDVTPAPTNDPDLAPFAAAHDVFGDGSLVLVPTPGHTPGSLSLLIRQAGRPPLLMVGDLTYDAAAMSETSVPGVGDRARLIETTRLIGAYRERHPDLVVLAAHDPAAEGMLARAMEANAS